jgi:hypothetical protein
MPESPASEYFPCHKRLTSEKKAEEIIVADVKTKQQIVEVGKKLGVVGT